MTRRQPPTRAEVRSGTWGPVPDARSLAIVRCGPCGTKVAEVTTSMFGVDVAVAERRCVRGEWIDSVMSMPIGNWSNRHIACTRCGAVLDPSAVDLEAAVAGGTTMVTVPRNSTDAR